MKFFHGFGDSHAAALDQHFGDVGGGCVGHGLKIHHQVGADFFEGAKAFFIVSVPVQQVAGFAVEFGNSAFAFIGNSPPFKRVLSCKTVPYLYNRMPRISILYAKLFLKFPDKFPPYFQYFQINSAYLIYFHSYFTISFFSLFIIRFSSREI